MRVYEKNGIKLGRGNLDRTTGSVVAVVIMHQAHINPSSLGLMLIIPYQSIITPAFLSFNKGGNHGSVIICENGKWSS
jgi:hypothetical protein